MAEFVPDYRSTAHLAASYEARASAMRAAAEAATDDMNRERYLAEAERAAEIAKDLRRRATESQ